MSTLTVALRMLFLPGSLELERETTIKGKKLRVGAFLGLLGFMLQGAYIFPADEVNLGNLPTSLEMFLNHCIGLIVGLVLFLMLLGFDTLVLGFLGVRGFKSPLYGSLAPFLVMPLATIPVHEIFFDQLSMRGYSVFVLVFAIVFLAWHVLSLGIYLSRDFSSTTLPRQRLIATLVVIFALEVACSISFILLAPPLFQASPQQFLEEYF